MFRPTLAMFTVLSLVSAFAHAQEVISVFLPDTDNQPLQAAIVATSGSVTSYAIECPPGTDSDACGIPSPITVGIGPSTVRYSMNNPEITAVANCALNGPTGAAVCSQSYGGSGANSPGAFVTTFQPSEINYVKVTIVSGSRAVALTRHTPTDTSDLGPSGTDLGGLPPATSTTSSGAASSATGQTASSSVHTGGMPHITGNAQLAAGGLAIALAVAGL
ncbi:MAG: hypothetical protein M1838_002914 [Thelocarpon superellum]|nr:MAG: hypothetical protein M1838_002914 [Thelocarpon superellum]